MRENIILIGTGLMAIDYVKVLKEKKCNFITVGRGEKSAEIFEEKTGEKVITGGIKQYIQNNKLPENSHVIIATGTEMLMSTLLTVLNAGAQKILIEKPAAISIEELLQNKDTLTAFADKIFVAYNRRFYASVIEAQRLIDEDGGLQNMHFEFTEWAHKIGPLEKAPGVKENWFFANSTHVVDLAFFLAGEPAEWNSYSQPGELSWHSKTNFSGAGITNKGVLFSYLSNWESAGRWGIELLTKKRRIYLKPLEGIGIQMKGTIQIDTHTFDDTLDKEFKPGLFKQVEVFLSENTESLIGINEHIQNSELIYSKIIS